MSYLDGRTPNASDVIAAFTDAMRQRGLIPPPELVTGKLARCRVQGARLGRRDGAYVLHLDDRPAGVIINWKDGQGREDWRYSNGSGTSKWTPAESAAFDAERAARKKADDEESRRLKAAAAGKAVAMYGNAGNANPAHAYLAQKKIGAHGVRQRGDELLVPRRDMRTDELVNLQRILPDGTKLNLTGGRVDGTWFVLSRPQPTGTILIGEGFATCATAYEDAGHPAVVSFGKDNLKAAAVELRRQNPHAKLVILADDDWKARDGNGGLTKAREAALAADAFLAMPKFGADRTDDAADFNDMHRLVGAEAVRAAIENATKVKREPPRPLTRPVDPASEYPIDALGTKPAAAVRAIEARTQAPRALCAQAVLGTMSLATQAHRNVGMPGGRQRPIGVYLLALVDSGGRKTSTDDFAMQPVREVERELQTKYSLELASFKNELAAWEQARKPSGKATKNKTAILADLKTTGDEPTPPRKPIILVSEPTQEGLVKLLAEGQPSVGLVSAEASTFIGGHGMNPESRLRMAGTLSKFWDDGSADRIRGGDGAVKLYNKRLTISLATQPGNGLTWLASPVLADQGLFSRLLIVAPESGIGTRFVTPETEERVQQTQDDLNCYHARIKELLEAVPKSAELTPSALRLSDAAHALWRDFSNAVEGEMATRGSLAGVRSFSNKAAEHTLRLAAILTVYHDHEVSEIDAETVVNAIELVRHYLGEATRISGMAAASEGSRGAQETLDFLRGLDHDIVHLAEIYQFGPSSVRTAAAARAVMGTLADHGFVEPIPDGKEIDGRHRSEAWRVLPTDEEAGQ